MDSNINPEDAKALLEKGLISQQTHDKLIGVSPTVDSLGNPYTQGKISSDVHEILPNIPKDAPVLAGNGILSSIAPGTSNVIDSLISIPKDVVGAVNQGAVANTATTSNQSSTQSGATPETFKDTLETRKGLDPAAAGAKSGVADIATQEKTLATPYGKGIADQGRAVLNQGTNTLKTSADDFKAAMKQSADALAKAETSVMELSQKARIEPNDYLNKLGVDGKIMTSIGLVLSGIGSGLSGQSNLAETMLQKNIDRNIQAQKDNYINAVTQAKELQNVAAGAKERAALANAAYQAAGVVVSTGVLTGLQGLQTQISGATAQGKSQVLTNQLQQQLFTYKQQFDEAFKSAAQSGDVKLMNMYKGLADKIDFIINGKSDTEGIGAPSQNRIKPTEPEQVIRAEPLGNSNMNKESSARSKFLEALSNRAQGQSPKLYDAEKDKLK